MSNGLKKINKVAFIVPEDLSWIGYKNYLINLITALDKKVSKNKIFVFCGYDKFSFIKKLEIKNIEVVYSSFLNSKTFLNYVKKFLSFLFGFYDPIVYFLTKRYKIDLISHHKPLNFVKTLVWFPDFQHLYLKKNFSKSELIKRDKLYLDYLKNGDIHLVSSYDAKKHLLNFSKKRLKKKINPKVLHFYPKINFSLLKNKEKLIKKYGINKNYIFIPNQFWKHKNHELILNTIKILKSKNIKIQFVFTGLNIDYRFPKHFDNILRFIEKEKIQDYFIFLGLIKYTDVISLIYNCKLFINPSFFEGWSSTVQEAKVFDKKMLLSNIQIHREQASKKTILFSPHSALELSRHIRNQFFIKEKNKLSLTAIKKKYEIERERFANEYFRIIDLLK